MKTLDLTIGTWKEGNGFISKCPELGVASCGDLSPEHGDKT